MCRGERAEEEEGRYPSHRLCAPAMFLGMGRKRLANSCYLIDVHCRALHSTGGTLLTLRGTVLHDPVPKACLFWLGYIHGPSPVPPIYLTDNLCRCVCVSAGAGGSACQFHGGKTIQHTDAIHRGSTAATVGWTRAREGWVWVWVR